MLFMSRQQYLADEIRRAMHQKLVGELRLRQRNIVFPDTVRNEGNFLRNLASKSAHAFPSHRVFALLMGFSLVISGGYVAISGMERGIAELLMMAVGLKIAVNALLREDQPKLHLPKTYPRVKI